MAFFVIVLTRGGPSSAWIAYSAAVLWALAAVAIEQWSASTLTGGAAVVCALLVLVAMFGPWGGAALGSERDAWRRREGVIGASGEHQGQR